MDMSKLKLVELAGYSQARFPGNDLPMKFAQARFAPNHLHNRQDASICAPCKVKM